MARKRLSDLLREEANKPEDDGKAAPPALPQPPATTASRRKRASAAAKPIAAKPAAATAPAPEPPIAPAPDPLIYELKASLERSYQHETELKEQIADLKADLKEQKAIVGQLQKEAEKARSFKEELDRAKADALQLADANTQLASELTALRESSKTAVAPAPVSQPATPPASQPPSPAPAATAQLVTQAAVRQQQARSLAHPVFPNKPVQASEPDVGWMD